MFALNGLSIDFTNGMKHEFKASHRLLSRRYRIWVMPNGAQQAGSEMPCFDLTDASQYLTCVMVKGVPQPAFLLFGFDKAPHFISQASASSLTQPHDGLSQFNLS